MFDDTGGGRRPPRGVNVLGGPLEDCSLNPVTGFYRDGCCRVGPDDVGLHAVCVVLTSEFLKFSMAAGNDLSTPRPEYGFPGLNPGDQWCLCAPRWHEAHAAGCAPQVRLKATSIAALAACNLDDLKACAIDLS